MLEEDILDLIKNDEWMMSVLKRAEILNLPDWVIGAGFVRNKVWDYLHGYSRQGVYTPDIDLVYFDPDGNNEKADEKLSRELKDETGINYEVVNEIYAHLWNDLPPYSSCEDAISKWPETATAVGVKMEKGDLKLIAPHGISDLVGLIIRPTPNFSGNKYQIVRERVQKKKWLEKWPKLKLA